MSKTEKVKKAQAVFAKANDHFAHVFEALGDPTRLKIFQVLAAKENLCVTDIAIVCNMSVPAASYQLKTLEMVGLVRRERTGRTICYILRKSDPVVKKVLKIIQ